MAYVVMVLQKVVGGAQEMVNAAQAC